MLSLILGDRLYANEIDIFTGAGATCISRFERHDVVQWVSQSIEACFIVCSDPASPGGVMAAIRTPLAKTNPLLLCFFLS